MGVSHSLFLHEDECQIASCRPLPTRERQKGDRASDVMSDVLHAVVGTTRVVASKRGQPGRSFHV